MASRITAALIKAPTVARGEANAIINYTRETLSLEIARAEARHLTAAEFLELYAEHIGRPYWHDLEWSVSGEIVAMALRGNGAVLRWRMGIGPSSPAERTAFQIRKIWGSNSVLADNAVHGSDSPEAARRELGILFPGDWYE